MCVSLQFRGICVHVEEAWSTGVFVCVRWVFRGVCHGWFSGCVCVVGIQGVCGCGRSFEFRSICVCVMGDSGVSMWVVGVQICVHMCVWW